MAQTTERNGESAKEQKADVDRGKCLMAGAAVITLLTVVMLMHLFLATLYIMFVPNWAEAYKSTVISRTEPLLYYLMALAILVIICQLKPSKRAANSMPEMQL